MTITIGIVANVYQEANALPGWLECHLPFADDVRVLHAGPGGEHSNDGTIEILEKWRIPVQFCAIDDGFGVVRTKALRMSPCDYVMILDADERFYPVHCYLTCSGDATPQHEVDDILRGYDPRRRGQSPDWDKISRLGAGLTVGTGAAYDQGRYLRELLRSNCPDAVCAVRRHWHDFSFKKPTQSWTVEPDWQLRILRNDPSIYFDPSTRMHERLIGANNVVRADLSGGPFFDHFHFAFKRLEQEQRAHDVAIYDAIHEGRKPQTWQEFSGESQRPDWEDFAN